MKRWWPGMVALVTLVGCGDSARAPNDTSNAGSAGDGAAPGSAGASTSGSANEGGASSGDPNDDSAGADGQGQAGDAPTPSSVLCKGAAPFGTPQPLVALNTGDHEAGSRLTPDELTMAYLCTFLDETSTCIARRANLGADFELDRIAVPGNGGVPWLSEDALTLLYESAGAPAVFMTQREAADYDFPQAEEVLIGFSDPYVVGGANGRLYLSNDYPGDLFVVALNDWQVPSTQPEPQAVPGASGDERDVRPVLTGDELTLYYAVDSGQRIDIWRKQRTSKNEPFGEGDAVSELNVTEAQFPGWISPDGCRIYFDSGDTERDLYVATRTP